jgi:hypothetical protein
LLKETGEWINWDCPNRLAFDPWFFCQHLEWQLEAPERENERIHTREWVKELIASGLEYWVDVTSEVNKLIDEMIEEGLINKDWTLAE